MLRDEVTSQSEVGVACETLLMEAGAYIHSFTLEYNLSTFGTHSWIKLGDVGHKDSSC